jgi:hypothetical protein
MRARRYCPHCLTIREHGMADARTYWCGKCGDTYAARFDGFTPAGSIARCAFCWNSAFFVQRDFDQRIGCIVLALTLILALLVGFTYGWIWFTPVLLVTALVDWLLARRIGTVTICYQCDAEYRDLPRNARHRSYDPHVAERYAKVKTVRRMR